MLNFHDVVTNDPGLSRSGSQPGITELSHRTSSSSNDFKSDEALRVLDLTKSFRSGFLRKSIRGIEGVSFTVPRGCLFALLGHNGAGKTTTINCILDLVHPDRGQVSILGQPNGDRSIRARVGYLPERPYFFEHLTGQELLKFYAKLLGVEPRDQKRRIESLVAKLGLESYLSRRLKKYSKGMLQRIGIAQALLGDPDLLIMDEPMSGLDPLGRRDVRELLLELKDQGKTIILSSHIVPDIEQVADTVGILQEGKLALIRDLCELEENASFEVVLQGQRRIVAQDVGALSEILEGSRQDQTAISRIQTRSTGLENLFLSVQGNQEAAR